MRRSVGRSAAVVVVVALLLRCVATLSLFAFGGYLLVCRSVWLAGCLAVWLSGCLCALYGK